MNTSSSGRFPRHPRARPLFLLVLALVSLSLTLLCSCSEDGEPIDRPDEFTYVYEAKGKHILRAIYQVLKDKELGKPVLNEERQEVTSDYIVQAGWRFRSIARIRKISRSENEVTLCIISEKKTPGGWELRRLLGKAQVDKIFDAIQTQIYREMYKMD